MTITKKIMSLAFSMLALPMLVSAQSTTSYTAAQVATHSTQADCWIIVSGNVYGVSGYISMHPGGSSTIVNQCGKDATTAFNTKGGNGSHSANAHSILNGLLVGALSVPTPTPTPTPVPAPTPNPVPTPAPVQSSTTQTFTSCIQASIEKRDTAIISARTTYSTAINSALTARKEAEKSAMVLTDVTAKKTALKKVANDYRTVVKKIQTTLLTSRKTALSTFESEAKTCQNIRKAATLKAKNDKKQEVENKKSEVKSEVKNKNKERGDDENENEGGERKGKRPTTTTTVPTTPTTTTTIYTAAQVATHSTQADCWIIVSGNVYGVSGYISMHPGGSSTIVNQCGKDATTAFNTKGGRGSHSSNARSILNGLLIGKL
jgi:cytochrome b involved in lipid metabolism